LQEALVVPRPLELSGSEDGARIDVGRAQIVGNVGRPQQVDAQRDQRRQGSRRKKPLQRGFQSGWETLGANLSCQPADGPL
jgi:hypothetical protein